MRMPVCTCRGQRRAQCVPQHLPCYSFEAGSLNEPRVHGVFYCFDFARLTVSKPHPSSCLCSCLSWSSLQVPVRPLPALSYRCGNLSSLCSSCLHSKCFYLQNVPSDCPHINLQSYESILNMPQRRLYLLFCGSTLIITPSRLMKCSLLYNCMYRYTLIHTHVCILVYDNTEVYNSLFQLISQWVSRLLLHLRYCVKYSVG